MHGTPIGLNDRMGCQSDGSRFGLRINLQLITESNEQIERKSHIAPFTTIGVRGSGEEGLGNPHLRHPEIGLADKPIRSHKGNQIVAGTHDGTIHTDQFRIVIKQLPDRRGNRNEAHVTLHVEGLGSFVDSIGLSGVTIYDRLLPFALVVGKGKDRKTADGDRLPFLILQRVIDLFLRFHSEFLSGFIEFPSLFQENNIQSFSPLFLIVKDIIWISTHIRSFHSLCR